MIDLNIATFIKCAVISVSAITGTVINNYNSFLEEQDKIIINYNSENIDTEKVNNCKLSELNSIHPEFKNSKKCQSIP